MEVDWERKTLNYISSRCMLMEGDWGGKLKLNYTSCGCINSMVDWRTHETQPNGHNIPEVDWGGHDSSSNHMNQFLFTEVDWGAHDSSFFLMMQSQRNTSSKDYGENYNKVYPPILPLIHDLFLGYWTD